MKNSTLFKVSKEEQLCNTILLSNFSAAFSACETSLILKYLHEHGIFFEKMNRTKAAGCFHKLFYAKNGINRKFGLEINQGFALGRLSGQEVLEFRWSDFNPFVDRSKEKKRNFGEPENKTFNEKVIRFAFSFKDGKIFTITIPTKFAESVTDLIDKN
jgi:hypothetical protein